jgi:hypothetical protein
MVQLEDHTFADELCAHFRRSGFEAERIGGGMIEVALRDRAGREQERRAIMAHLLVWQAMYPESGAEILSL